MIKDIASSCFQQGNYFGNGEMEMQGFLVVNSGDTYHLWYGAGCYKGDKQLGSYTIKEIADLYFKGDVDNGAIIKHDSRRKRYIVKREAAGKKADEVVPQRVMIEDFFRKEIFKAWQTRLTK